jgi:hypothetical protein
MITSITYLCRICGKPRTEKYESHFKGIKPEDYRCRDCYRAQQKIMKDRIVSYICCVCGRESNKMHHHEFKLKNHKWTCLECSRLINDVQTCTS